MRENKKAHTNLMRDKKFRKKFQYDVPAEEESESEESESSESESSEEEDDEKQKFIAQKRIDSNPFLKMIVSNVDKAFKYNPAKQDRPTFKFYGAGAVSLNKT
jgi:hypothetical protein